MSDQSDQSFDWCKKVIDGASLLLQIVFVFEDETNRFATLTGADGAIFSLGLSGEDEDPRVIEGSQCVVRKLNFAYINGKRRADAHIAGLCKTTGSLYVLDRMSRLLEQSDRIIGAKL